MSARRLPLVAFDRVTKFNLETAPPDLLFGNVSMTLRTDRNTAILGRKETGRTTLLQMLQGQLRPDAGEVVTNTKFSMLLNTKTYMHPGLNGLQNSSYLARLYGLDGDALARLLVTLPGLKPGAWYMPVRDLDARDRKSMELLLAALMPFECYVIDDLEKLEINAFRVLLKFAGARQAGTMFTTFSPKFARQFADQAAVIANRSLYLFDSVAEAERFYDR
jgi:capsular polysaccharide transport system ATP-binding protein